MSGQRERISAALGSYLLKGYCMLATTCPRCDTVLMRDRQQREMCVWCDDLNAAQTRRGDAAGSTTAAAPTAPNTTSVPSTTAVAAAPATASATAAPSSSSSSSTAAAAARPAADVDGVSAMLEDDVDPLPLPASAAAAAGTNTPAGATVPESSSPSSGPVRYSMRTPVGSPAVTNTTNAAAAAAAPNTPNGQQIAAAATFTTPTRGGGAPAQHSPSLGASGMRRAMLDSPSIRNASQLPDSLLARLNGHQAVNVNATHLATDAHLEDGGHNQPMNYVPTTSTYNFYDPASIMAAYSAQSSAAAGGVNADSARQHTAVMSQVRYSAQLGVQALNAKLQQAAQLLASTPNINEAMELCQVMTACSTAIQSLQALL